ncbi:hypothetical protein [Streptomyces sp. NPDC087300]|uniref:hypothetical protein n=1 Tax=Streptomyces sp. NPDC087300 TaxID=3365780 RepID=UPI00382D0DAB
MPKPRFLRRRSDDDGEFAARRALGTQTLMGYGTSGVSYTPRTTAWQSQAWRDYKRVGAVRFGVNTIARACSLTRLTAARIDPTGDSAPEPIDDDRYQQVLADFGGGQDGQAELIDRAALHIQVPGQTFLCSWETPDGERMWHAASTSELSVGTRPDSLTLRMDAEGTQVELTPDNSFVSRIWRRDPEQAWEADSPMRSLSDDFELLCLLNGYNKASARSRLTGAGVWMVSNRAQMASHDGKSLVQGPQAFAQMLGQTAARAKKDPDSPAAMVPIVMAMDPDDIKAQEFQTFETPFSERIPELQEGCLRRIALGMDMPPEKVLGLSGMGLSGGEGRANHWGGWLADEETIKTTIRPLLKLFCSAITRAYYLPALKHAGLDTKNVVIVPNLAALEQRPNRSAEAIQLRAVGALSDEAARREAGFGDADAPDEEQRREQIGYALATNPTSTELGLSLLGISAPQAPAQARTEAPAPQAPARPPVAKQAPARATPTTPAPATDTRSLPSQPSAPTGNGPKAPTAITAAADQAVLRALEVAGKRMLDRGTRHRFADVHPWELHTRIRPDDADLDRLLAGAWSMLAATGTDAATIGYLDQYTRQLLTNGRPHTPGRLP